MKTSKETHGKRVVVITGGASGIGRACVEAFKAEGHPVAILDRRIDPGQIAEAALEVDVADEPSVQGAFAEVRKRLGTVDILVNSAGLLTEVPVQEMDLAVWEQTLVVDLTGVFLCCREVVGPMVEQRWGRIINISSQLGIKGGRSLAHYAAAKAGVIGFSKALALEVAGANVLVNCIAPGPIETPLVEAMSESWKAAKRAELPLLRFGVPEEIAPTALLLASEPGGNLYVGQTLGPNSGDVMP